ncbi:hypothetical protein MTR67_000692 [Solanum verrucosum]|uniref:Uncharacterized protein n=1 Tax=Solanum verrucosum TaxID=315347 RepID=A0AAF0PMW6_SOLVR|nr:hypothetical protein MTR67_000692 [Solanum verrucosum]
MGIQRQIGDWNTDLNWVNGMAKSKQGKSAIVSCGFGLLVAVIWRERNQLRFRSGNFQADNICREITCNL